MRICGGILYEVIMIEFNSKILTIIVNIFLGIWQITQWLTAGIGLLVFRNCEFYCNKEAGITVLKVNKGYFNGGACFSSGPVIFVTPDCEDDTLRHETGHSIQSLIFGPLFHIVVTIPSVIRFCIKRFCNKDHSWYLSAWPEGGCRLGAEALGHTNR